MGNVFIFIVFLILVFFYIFNSKNNKSGREVCITGGKRSKHKCIWDLKCLDRNMDLDDLLHDYERKKIGNKNRKILRWYKPSYSARQIMDKLIKEKYDMYAVKLRSNRGYLDYCGNIVRKNSKNIAPHFIFLHKDLSCARLKPISSGFPLFHPSISFSIVYDHKKSGFGNEGFKLDRNANPLPKSTNSYESCINEKLSDYEIEKMMGRNHIILQKAKSSDINYFLNFSLDD